MLLLFTTTITASFFDSLNPSAIAQQILLQAMVKKKRDILYFILGISLANMLMGIAIYYGITAWLQDSLNSLVQSYPVLVYGTEFIIGIAIIIILIRYKNRIFNNNSTNELASIDNNNLNGLSLFIMGGTFCVVELTSALPYFGFLAMLSSYNLSSIFVLCFIALYTFIYALPLILLYIGYNRLQGTTFIKKLELSLNKISSLIVPSALIILSLICLFHSIYSLVY